MSDSWSGGTNWFNFTNWSFGVPLNIPFGAEAVVINGSVAHQPTISPTAIGAIPIFVAQTLSTGAGTTVLNETQIDGQSITLANHADLTIQGVALGVFYGNCDTATLIDTTMTGLHGALTAAANADMHMQLSVVGADTLTVDTLNENFGFITIGNGDTLSIANIETGGNAQQLHGLINYGEISVSTGGLLNITDQAATNGTVANFYNAGWIVDNGGTLNISSSVLDGASTQASDGGIDGFIELGQGALAILSGTVGSGEQVDFLDGRNDTLQLTAGSLFAGAVNNFGAGNTIDLAGFTASANATITAAGGVTELITASGSVLTTITLSGAIATNFADGINTAGQEYITAGSGTINGVIVYAGGTETLASATGTLLNNGSITVTGAGAGLIVNSSLTGNGALFIDNGATLALDNAAGNDAGQKLTFGTHGALSAPNTLLINDDAQGFAGSVSGFGANDEIVLGPKVLTQPAAGSSILLNYGNGVLTVQDTASSNGAIISSTNITLSGTPALATASFVALQSAAGEIIELASTAAGQNFVFSIASQSTGSFEAPASYTGGIAPGDLLAPGETVTIASGTATVSSAGLTDNGRITVASGASFIDGKSLAGSGTLAVFGSATLTGATNLTTITDAGTLSLAGADAVAINITGQAAITGNFSDSAAITGTGRLSVAKNVSATLASGSSLASVADFGTLALSGIMGGSIDMQGNGAGTVADFLGADAANYTLDTALTNFGYGDTLLLGPAAFAVNNGDHLTETYNAATGQVSIADSNTGGHITIDLGLTAGDPSGDLQVSETGGQVELTLCFYPGTALAAPGGEIKVEDIRPGDVLMTANGLKPVRWVGQSHIHTGFADGRRCLPVRIREGALGAGLPLRDLLLSPDHAIAMDGILVQASALVNGAGITREYAVPEQFTYYHIELDSHELLFAEGVGAESFVNNVHRMHFHNWDERSAPETEIMELPLPRAKSVRQLSPALRARLGLTTVAAA